jgi:hypothetical protein
MAETRPVYAMRQLVSSSKRVASEARLMSAPTEAAIQVEYRDGQTPLLEERDRVSRVNTKSGVASDIAANIKPKRWSRFVEP